MSPTKDKGCPHLVLPPRSPPGGVTQNGPVTSPPTNKLADTRVSIHPDLAARWSPRSFDPDAVVTVEQLTALLEAARWAATWGRRQPVRFVVGRRGNEAFAKLAGVLKRGNSYARAASALILVCADEGSDETSARYAALDAGAAIAQLTVEAVSRGLIAHPMAGFDGDAAREVFGIPDGVRPLAVVAVGTLGDYADAPADLVERDSGPRHRLPLDEVVLNWPI